MEQSKFWKTYDRRLAGNRRQIFRSIALVQRPHDAYAKQKWPLAPARIWFDRNIQI